MSSLPALLEKKRLIDMHTSIATVILEQIKHRKLDVFFELEEKIMSKLQMSAVDEKAIKDVFEDPDAGTPEDKMRLFVIYFLCTPDLQDSEVDRISELLEVDSDIFLD